jgi:16S rRNA (guanine966-N2)-methyltransferase
MSKASRVRILAGRWRGRALEVPPDSRPTSSRAREALFDILGTRIEGARVLDLYAGSGAVGLEALSRGARLAVFVEPDAGALGRNLARLSVSGDEARILVRRAEEALTLLESGGERFDLVFSDPPYEGGAASRWDERIAALLFPGALFILQQDAAGGAPDLPPLAPRGSRAYGRNVFHFYALAA